MNALELARFILAALLTDSEFGRSEQALLRDARVELDRQLTQPQLEQQLREMADKCWITPYSPALAGKRWRITKLGRSIASEEGL